MSKNNIFKFATSELSQDAFICWLLSWSNDKTEEYKSLRETSLYFIKSMQNQYNKDFNNDIHIDSILNIDIRRQEGNIDILAIIDTANSRYALVIEDKIFASQHGKQLDNYKKFISDEYKDLPETNIIFIYLKTGDQSNLTPVKTSGYSPFMRKDLLNVLEFGIRNNITNDILTDFYMHLMDYETEFNKYAVAPVSEWIKSSASIIGFLSAIQKELKDAKAEWGYVNNESGGFWGLWWHSHKLENNDEIYLQIEVYNALTIKLCYKIYVDDKAIRASRRNAVYNKITGSDHNFIKPKKFGTGSCMTVAIYKGNFPMSNLDGFIDFKKTVDILKETESNLDEFCRNFK